jgi:single-strand DNA-binding protein
VGYLGADAEVRYTAGGDARAIAKFSMATREKWPDGAEAEDDTQWHRCVAWDKLGELAGELLKKGAKVYVEGRMRTRKWIGKDKVPRYTTEIVVDEFSALAAAPPAAPKNHR